MKLTLFTFPFGVVLGYGLGAAINMMGAWKTIFRFQAGSLLVLFVAIGVVPQKYLNLAISKEKILANRRSLGLAKRLNSQNLTREIVR